MNPEKLLIDYLNSQQLTSKIDANTFEEFLLSRWPTLDSSVIYAWFKDYRHVDQLKIGETESRVYQFFQEQRHKETRKLEMWQLKRNLSLDDVLEKMRKADGILQTKLDMQNSELIQAAHDLNLLTDNLSAISKANPTIDDNYIVAALREYKNTLTEE